jgi:cytoskeletal protein CcmA (bactofilin family)
MFEKGKSTVSGHSTAHATETIVGSSVKLKGNLRSDGPIKIYGILTGEVRTKDTVLVGPEANIVASIKARNIKISGTVQGNIEASDRLEITETGRVLGDISANILSISPGAIFSGKCVMSERGKEIAIEPIIETETPEKEEVVSKKTK